MDPRLFKDELQRCASKKGLKLEDVFKEHDPKKTGTVPYKEFRAILSQIGYWASEDRIMAAASPFMHERKDFSFREFLGEQPADPANDCVAELAGYLRDRELTLEALVKPFDTRNIGRVSVDNFVRALGTEPVVTRICNKYKSALMNDIDYIELGRKVREILRFGEAVSPPDSPRPVKAPPEEPPQDLPPVKTEPVAVSEPEPEPEPEPEEPAQTIPPVTEPKSQKTLTVPPELINILRVLQSVEGRYTFNFDLEFRVYDTTDSGVLRETPFAAVIRKSLAPISPQEYAQLLAFYSRGPDEVDYRRLVSDIHEFTQTFIPMETTKRAHGDSMDVMVPFKRFIEERHISPNDIFSNYDTLKNGTIPKARLRNIFDSLGFDVSTADEERLKDDYESSRFPEMLDYRSLCLTLDQIPPSMPSPRSRTAREEAQDRDLPAFIKNLRERIHERPCRKDVRYPFAGFKNPMSENDFRSCLSYFGLALREFEIQILLRNYTVRGGGIDWQKFVGDLEGRFQVI